MVQDPVSALVHVALDHVQLLLGRPELGLGVFQLDARIIERAAAAVELVLSLGQRLRRLGKLGPAVVELLSPGLQLLLGLVQLFLLLLEQAGIALSQLLDPQRSPDLAELRQRLLHRVDSRQILGAVAVGGRVLDPDARLHERPVQGFQIEALVPDQNVRRELDLSGDVVRVPENARDHVFLRAERIDVRDRRARRLEPLPDGKARFFGEPFLHGALVRALGQTSLQKVDRRELAGKRKQVDRLIFVRRPDLGGDLQNGLRQLHALGGADRGEVLVVHQEHGHDLQIPHPVLRVVIRRAARGGVRRVGDAEVGRDRQHGDDHD